MHKDVADISIVKQEFIKSLQLAAAYTSPNLHEIIALQTEAIFAAIEEALITTILDIDTVASSATVAELIARTAAAINADKSSQASENDSAAKINQFENAAKRLYDDVAKYSSEIDDIATIINSLQPALGKIPQAELSKFINSPAFKSFETKVQEYQKQYEHSDQE